MTNTTVGFIIGGAVSVCVTIASIFIFTSEGLRKTEKCYLTNFIPSAYFSYFDIPILSITSILMLYAYYSYYKMARKTQSEVTGQVGNAKAQRKVTRTMFTVIGVFLTSNIIWYTVFFATDGMDNFGVSVLVWFSDALWLVSTRKCVPEKLCNNTECLLLYQLCYGQGTDH